MDSTIERGTMKREMIAQRERTFAWDDPIATAQQLRNYGGLEALQKIIDGELPPPPVAHLLGMSLDHAEEGMATFSLTPQEFHYNPIGSVHGGIISTLMDSALGCAVQSMLPHGTLYTTSQLNVNFIRPITSETGRITCTATAIHVGRKMATAEARIVDANGKLYAHGTTTCIVFG